MRLLALLVLVGCASSPKIVKEPSPVLVTAKAPEVEEEEEDERVEVKRDRIDVKDSIYFGSIRERSYSK